LKRGATLRFPDLPKAVEARHLDRLFVVPCALGLESGTQRIFYETTNHADCSSLLKPRCFNYKESTATVWRLADFLACLDFPVIDYLKIDTQGTDLDVIKGGEDEIKRRVVFVTLEAESEQYEGADKNTQAEADRYMQSLGFMRVAGTNTKDPTYLNSRLRDKTAGCIVYQRT
jgi:FkbM family methyltransferase